MLKQFFSSSQIKESFKLDDASDSQQNHTIMLLSGPPNSGKTSILFQYAYNRAVNGRKPVIFICNKKRMHSNPPFLSQGIDPSSDVFSRIKMKYIENDEEIRKYFAAFHLHDSFPAAVVIDDFGDFFDERTSQDRYGNARGRDLAMVRTLALSRDAIDHANKKLQPQDFCQLLLSDTHHGDGPRQLFVYKKWLSCIFTIRGDGRGSFLLGRLGLGNASEKRTCFAKYTVALQYLTLEGTAEE
ncbi:uncharacterized protein LOC116257849 [Nymphaea colorata]|nr:uncharacterized protein LOC116257849 [Nymphaea colorata]